MCSPAAAAVMSLGLPLSTSSFEYRWQLSAATSSDWRLFNRDSRLHLLLHDGLQILQSIIHLSANHSLSRLSRLPNVHLASPSSDRLDYNSENWVV